MDAEMIRSSLVSTLCDMMLSEGFYNCSPARWRLMNEMVRIVNMQ